MYIKKIYIESFCGMKDRELCFAEGLNVIEGGNESGKSTLCMFIKFIFYGLSGRTSDGEMSERQKYVPWDTGRAAGTLEIVTSKGEYRISRELSVSDGETPRERLSVIDTQTGDAVFKGKIPGVCILGMDEQMFVNTVFVRQIGGTAIDGTGMAEAIENILLSGDESVSLKKALDRLDKARKALMHKRGSGGALQTAMQECAVLERELSESRQKNGEMIELESEAEKLSSLIDIRTRERDKNASLCDAYLKIRAGERAKAGLMQKEKTQKLDEALSELEKYGNISEKTGKINAYFARCTAVEARLSSLRDSLGEEPDRSLRMTEEDVLSARTDMAQAKKYDKKRKMFAVWAGIIFALGAVLFACGTYLKQFLEISFGGIVGYAGIAVLIVGMLMTVLCAVNSSKLKTICKKWGSGFGLSSLEAEIESRISKAAGYDSAVKEREQKLSAVYESEEERRKILALLRTAALEFSDEDFEKTEELVDAALLRASEIFEKRERLSGEAGVARGELSAFADVLSDDEGRGAVKAAEEALSTEEGRAAKSFEKKDFESCKNKRLFAESVLPGLLKRKGEVDTLLARLKATTKDTAILCAQLESAKKDIESMKKRLAGIEEAIKALGLAGEGLRSSLVPKALAESERLLSGFTDEKYVSLALDGDFSVSFKIDGVKRDIYYMSAGTADAAYISLRASLARVLFKDDALPLIYDESFARIDEKRLSEILSMLCDSGVQSLVFTCRALEGEISEGTRIRL